MSASSRLMGAAVALTAVCGMSGCGKVALEVGKRAAAEVAVAFLGSQMLQQDAYASDAFAYQPDLAPQGEIVSWQGQWWPGGVQQTIVYRYYPNGVVLEEEYDAWGNYLYSGQGTYYYDPSTNLTTIYWDSGSIETAEALTYGSDQYLHRIISHTGDASQVGLEIVFSRIYW